MCHEHGIKVESVPGPTAFATAMAISGMPSGRFTFEGFLSVNKASRTEHIQSIVKEPRTMIFYEAPHKIGATLRDLAAALGDREIAIVREITKIHEEVIRTTLCAAAEKYADGGLKGEIVLIIAGAKPEEKEQMAVEQAVAREVMEESGIKVKNLRYVTSQPWPFPQSLMTAFMAEYDSGEIVIDPKELLEANWYRYDDLPLLPPPGTVARRLIEDTVAMCRAEYE